jgi:hypothetical protein
MQLGAINTSSSKVSYFLLKADRPTTVAQTHNVRVFNGNPAISGNTELYSCKFTFQRVRETIKAAANKVKSVSSNTVSAIGDELVITHEGQTGVIGAGSAPDNDIVWISPASNASWPTRALKLTRVEVSYYSNKACSAGKTDRVDELILLNASKLYSTGGSGKTSGPECYVATYRFKVIGQGKATIAPVVQISSGTQIKHTDMAGFYNSDGSPKNPVDTTDTPVSATATKVGAGSTNITVDGANVVIGYSISITNNGANPIVIDDLVDTASSELVYRTGSAYSGGAYPGTTPLANVPYSSATLQADGTVDTSTQNWTFTGPFSLASNETVQIHYAMLAPCQSGSYPNTAVARIGDTVVGTSNSTIQQVSTNLNLTLSGSTCVINSSSQETETVTRGTDVITSPATGVSTTTDQTTEESVSSATLNGSVDSNGVSEQTIRCEYSTDANMAGSNLVSASTPVGGKTTTSNDPIAVACGLNNLVAGTVYHFRINVLTLDGKVVLGGILNFTTPPASFSTPTVVTTSASNFSTTTDKGTETVNLTLNGNVNPRGNPTRVRFQYSAGNTACTSLTGITTTLSTLDYDDNDAPTLNLVLNGGFETQVSFPITGLATGTTYCYRILGDYPWDAAANTSTDTRLGSWVSFFASGTNPPTLSTEPATSITNTSATLNGTVTKGTNNATISFCLSTVESSTAVLTSCITGLANPSPTSVSSGTVNPTLAATSLTASTRYYFQVIATDSSTSRVSYGNIETFTTTGPPLATTSSATNVLSTSATLNGSVIANGADATVYFCYVLDNPSVSADADRDGYLDRCVSAPSTTPNTNLTDPTVTTPIAANASAARASNLSGLAGSSKYHFQILANSANGRAKGEILYFTTTVAATTPVVTTVDATSVAGTTATLNGTITAGNAATTATFCLGTNLSLSGCTQVAASPSTVSGNSITNISVNATGLTAGTTYYFKAQGTNSAGSAEGEIKSFTTTSDPAVAVTNRPNPIGVTTATLLSTITAGTQAIQSVEFCLATSNTVTAGVLQNCGAGTQGVVSGGTIAAGQTGTPSVAVTGLTGGTNYYVQVKATPQSPGVVAYGEVLTFTTDVALATAQTIAADSISITSARLNGKVSTGTYSGIVSFCISTTGDTAADTIGTCLSGSLGTVSQASFSAETAVTDVDVSASDLVADTNYYFKVIITPSTGDPVSGEVLSFQTEPLDPEATTVAASSVAGKSAKLNASIKAGSKKVSVRFCLSTAATTSSWGGGAASVLNDCPNTSTNWRTASSLEEIDGNDTGTPFLDTTGLTPNTTYYFQVGSFPTSGNPAFGDVKSFKTPLIKPEVRTLAPTDVSETGARLNGEANANNSKTTVRFCVSRVPGTINGILNACVDSDQVSFSTTRTPNNGADIQDGSLVTFRQADLSETDLEDDVTYYYQAIATNDAGTAVGEVMSFTTGEKRPEATTAAASSVAGKTARLNGSAKAGSKQINVKFCLSTANTTSFWSGANVLSSCPSGDSSWRNPNVASTLNKNIAGVPYLDSTGLIPNKTYFFQIGSFPTSGDPAFGEVKSFKTPLIAPEVETLAPSNVSETGARLNAAANANNSRTTVRFCISESSATTDRLLDECADTSDVSRTTFRTPTSGDVIDGSEEVLITDQEAKLSIDDLENETTYYYQAIATNDAGTTTGNVLTFTTSSSNSITFPGPGTGGGSGGGGSSSNPNNPITPVNPGLIPNAPTAPNAGSGAASASGGQGSGSASDPGAPTLATLELGNRSMTLAELARERTPGVSDGTGISVLVTGSRVTGQFVVTPGESLDSIGLALALEESSGRWGEDFANISSANSIPAPSSASVYNAPVDETALDTFSRSGLQKPKTLTDFNFSPSSKWLSVSADANTYLPGTKIYLTVTSEPVIFAEAVVDRNGQAQLVGALPLDILPAGGHSIRVVGTRSIEGVSADSEGILQLSSEAIDKISKFDAGTMATVVMSGDTPLLNQQRLVREILLGKGVPWWTIWFAAIVSLVSLGFLLYRRKSLERLSPTTPLVAIAGSIPAIALGWWTISYLISYLGLAIGLGSAAILVALTRNFANKNTKAKRKTKRVSA